jgi:pseudaminic acid biosynthesis-associated methylase
MSMMRYRTEQEDFWAGSFGDSYVDRSQNPELIAPRLHKFCEILKHCGQVGSFLEFGSNVGLNLIALHYLMPKAKLTAMEINEKAVRQVKELGFVEVHHGSLLGVCFENVADFVFSAGVLIHITPASTRYLSVSEYFNPVPIEVEYRGHRGRLWKRDFAGEMLHRFKDLSLPTRDLSTGTTNFFPM